jgi:hypothetical protein
MGYRLLADVVMLAHFAFLAYLALGGFLAWRRRWLLVPHLAAVVWGALSATVGIACPLTAWEDAARRRAGAEGLPRGFVDTYLTGVVYPRDHLLAAQLLVAALVLVSWAGLAVRLRRRAARQGGRMAPTAGPASHPSRRPTERPAAGPTRPRVSEGWTGRADSTP